VLLLLDALAHRDHVEDKDRARVPVPVLFTPHDWDPTTCSVQDWLAARLAANYPMFQHRGGHAEAAALVAAGAVTLILDGFDEMDLARRPAALRALNDATFRVVVLTRGDEMIEAAGDAWLVESVALHLDPVAGAEGADYLQRATGPSPVGWTQLLTHLQQNPDSALTNGLSTPLALTLIRDTYRPGDDLSALLPATHGGTTDGIGRQLIARVLPDAYNPRPGRPTPRYSPTQAKQMLAFLARQMNHDHTGDLAWWHIPRWAPSTPRIRDSILVGGLVGGLLGMLILGPLLKLSEKDGLWVTLVEGLVFGLGLGFASGRGGTEPQRIRAWRAIKLRPVVTAALGYCVVVFVASIATLVPFMIYMIYILIRSVDADSASVDEKINHVVLAWMLVYGFVVAFPFAVKRNIEDGSSERNGGPQGSLKSRSNGRVLGIVVLTVGIAVAVAVAVVGAGVVVYLRTPMFTQVAVMVLVGLLVMRLVYWLVRLAVRFAARLVVSLAENASNPQEPRESWRNDRVFRLIVGLIFGLAVGLPMGLLVSREP
jgi:hypothetical protein